MTSLAQHKSGTSESTVRVESPAVKQVSLMPSVYMLLIIVMSSESKSFNVSVLVKVLPETKEEGQLRAARGPEPHRRKTILLQIA